MHPIFDEIALCLRAEYSIAWLLTWEEDRARRGLTEVAASIQRPLMVWTAANGIDGAGGPPTLSEVLKLLVDKGPAVVALLDAHQHLDVAAVRALRDAIPGLIERQQSLVLVSARASVPDELSKDVVLFQLPLPGLKEVARLFHEVLADAHHELDLDLFERFVKASLGLTEGEIRRLYRKILIRHGSFGEAQIDVVIAEKRQIIHKAEYLEFHDLSRSMQEVGGLDNLKEWLRERSGSFTEKARKFGLPQPRGLFLLGVQGCGKSLTAKAVADLWKVPLLRLDVGALVLGKGAAEEGLRRTIAVAESMAPAVLWVDEIEKAFAGVGDAGSGGAARVLGGFITWLQEKTAPVFVVATANDVRGLPPELLRKGRFDELFWVDLPNVHERQSIYEIHLRRRGREPSRFDTWKLAEASDRFSGAEIEQAIVDALFLAFSADREVETLDVVRAVRDTVPLAVVMDQQIKELKEWARDRTRPATFDTRRVDFFSIWQPES